MDPTEAGRTLAAVLVGLAVEFRFRFRFRILPPDRNTATPVDATVPDQGGCVLLQLTGGDLPDAGVAGEAFEAGIAFAGPGLGSVSGTATVVAARVGHTLIALGTGETHVAATLVRSLAPTVDAVGGADGC